MLHIHTHEYTDVDGIGRSYSVDEYASAFADPLNSSNAVSGFFDDTAVVFEQDKLCARMELFAFVLVRNAICFCIE